MGLDQYNAQDGSPGIVARGSITDPSGAGDGSTCQPSLSVAKSGGGEVSGAHDTATVSASDVALAISKHADHSTIHADGVVSYTIVVRNTGRQAAHGVLVCDPLPGALGYLQAPHARFVRGIACWRLDHLVAGATARYHLRAHVSATAHGSVTNVATVQARNVRRARARASLRVIGRSGSRSGGVTG